MEFYGAVELALDPAVGIRATPEARGCRGDRAEILPKIRAVS